jgi:cobalt/nickel transport protein
MKRYQNVLMLIAVAALVALPLWMVKRPVPGTNAEIFQGADDRAKDVIISITPGYQPWFKPLLEPPGENTGSVLFALQAALGAGFIGYYVRVSTTRARMRRETGTQAGC